MKLISEPGATVERISYGERIVLRPDPVPSDRGYEKGEIGYCEAYMVLLRWGMLMQLSNHCSLFNPLRTSRSQRSLWQRSIL